MMKKHNADYLKSKPCTYLYLYLITDKYVKATFPDNPMPLDQKRKRRRRRKNISSGV